MTASIIYSYIPSNTSMKLPEIPGRIIAQIAIAQQIKIYGQVISTDRAQFCGSVIKKARTQNRINARIVFQFRLTCFPRNIAEIKINPIKNDQTSIGYLSMAFVMMFARNTILVPIHNIKHKRKFQSIFSQKVFHFHVKKFFRFGTTFLIAWMSLSYIPVIIAIVHQLTHGTTSHAHISIPFKKIRIFSRILFISCC